MTDLIASKNNSLVSISATFAVPEIFVAHGERSTFRFFEFFTANIRNENTRHSYHRAIVHFFAWLEQCYPGLALEQINSIVVAQYIETTSGSSSTKNQRLAAVRALFNWLIKGNVLRDNPTTEVRGIKNRIKQGKTPVLTDEEMIDLFNSIDTEKLIGLRDRALIGAMFYSFARISAVLGMDLEDYFQKGKRSWFRLLEKGGKYHEVPAHHTVEEYIDQYLKVAGLTDAEEKKNIPLFQTFTGRSQKLSGNRMQREEAWAMVKRRAIAAGVNLDACNHTFRASGITNFLYNGGSRDNAQRIAAHEDVRTTALYDRRGDEISLDEIERIRL
ncbi:MAG: tyrosine-type recombinase/integrase [Limnothrix sp. RL_2_0]|nr:tyrosine-type recombinase/integrase [Limnothrix sp. RL_2_0]